MADYYLKFRGDGIPLDSIRDASAAYYNTRREFHKSKLSRDMYILPLETMDTTYKVIKVVDIKVTDFDLLLGIIVGLTRSIPLVWRAD